MAHIIMKQQNPFLYSSIPGTRDQTLPMKDLDLSGFSLPSKASPPQDMGSPANEEMIREPTETDVLLGRGVSTNRHPGNVNFRNLVSQYVTVYVTSTKKQKMMISRSIVDKVRTDLNPPGRFLEKESSGLWVEVSVKKALEKTAQALRDGAFPLRKQLSEDFSDSNFLEAEFDTKDKNVANAPKPTSTHPLRSSSSNNRHQRRTSAPVLPKPTLVDFDLPDPKRSKPNSPNNSQHETFQDMNVALRENLTGINFPSQAVSRDARFLIGSNIVDTATSVEKHHRRNCTFGGYSCSDRNDSDMSMDNIFALYLGPSSKHPNTSQQPVHQSAMTNDNYFSAAAPSTLPSGEHRSQNNVGAAAFFEQNNISKVTSETGTSQYDASGVLGRQQGQQAVWAASVNAALWQLQQSPGAHDASIQDDMMVYSPQPSPSPQRHLTGGTLQHFEAPLPSHLLGQHHLNLMTTISDTQVAQSFGSNTGKKLNGVKRHRRHNTIANGDCFSDHRCASVPDPASENVQQFNLDFLSNNKGSEEPHHVGTTTVENQDLPLQEHGPSSETMGRHRRLNTTGNLGLPKDWNFSLGEPFLLNTIHEDKPNASSTHECGSLLSSNAETGYSLMRSTGLKPTRLRSSSSSSSINAILDTLVPHSVQGHRTDESNKSSLSTEDFCWRMMTGEASSGESDNDGFTIVDDDKMNDWQPEDEDRNFDEQHSMSTDENKDDEGLDSQSLGFSKLDSSF